MVEPRQAPAQAPPETGSVDGVRLHGGALRAEKGLSLAPDFQQGALYAVFPRAFSPEGTLAAVTPRLDALVDLGVSTLWFLPIHPVGRMGAKGSRGSPYAVRDYRAVAPDVGSLESCRALVEAAHARGLRVLIDFVANHAALDHVAREAHPEWFARDGQGQPTRRVADWSDVMDWRFEAVEAAGAAEYLMESARFWIREVGIDGFRCDVAGMVPVPFWRDLHASIATDRPDHCLLAEWQDAGLHTVAFHASYDWLLYRALRDTALGRVGASAVGRALTAWSENFPRGAVPLRFLENHDEPRAAALLGRERLPAYAATAFLSGGWPLLYAGQEIGTVHRPSLFEAEPVDWSRSAPEVHALYRSLLVLRSRAALWGPGEVAPVATDRPETVVAFARSGEDKRGLVVANLGRDGERVRVTPVEGCVYRRVWGGEGPLAPDGSLTLRAGEAWVGETP